MRYIRLAKVKCQAEKLNDTKFKVQNIFTPIIKNYAIVESEKKDKSVTVLYNRRKNARYHFRKSNYINIYIGRTRSRHIRYNRKQVNIIDWELKSKMRYPDTQATDKIILFYKAPMDIISSNPHDTKKAGNGDKLLDFTVYTVKKYLTLEKSKPDYTKYIFD